jgi:hypothetical protein
MPLSHNLETFFFLKKDFLEKDSEREEMDGRDGTREDTQDTTRFVEIEGLKRAIRALLFVTKVSRVDTHKDKETGWGTTLKCASCPGCCGKKQEPVVQLSRDRKSELAFLQELLKRLQDRRVHDENEGHSRHHARQGTHHDRKNNVVHSSGSALASHVLQKGVTHGTRKYTD